MTLAIGWPHEVGENLRTWPHEGGVWHFGTESTLSMMERYP